jgi:tetratricopeptide (TPR) repeat protein
MAKLNIKAKKEFQTLHTSGLKAMASNKPQAALKFFTSADDLARLQNDRRQRLDVLNPMANALWSLGEYDQAKQKLAVASKIATELTLMDELAIAFSNQGRLNAVKIVLKTPLAKQTKELQKDALPYFMKAHNMLALHDHLYFRYMNAKYGSLIAALCGDYRKAAMLISEGMGVAYKKSRKYDKEFSAKINPSGLEYFAAVAQLVSTAERAPGSRELKAQEKLARELVK